MTARAFSRGVHGPDPNRAMGRALVDVHPFGGFNMSGTDSKAGGRDYLLLYTQAKSVSEGM
jgi:1-pyrroline-5-carboxylate dehydrogenase